MSDSVDRVFAHALSTVRKIPHTGTARPPTADRLKLYGLYKQSMEGDVEGVMTRPSGMGVEDRAEADKWDAWHSCAGLSKTEAKKRYIAQLIQTMHKYAASTAEARALVEELEFVWDQVKGNWSPDAQPSSRNPSGSGSGLRVMKPMSDPDAASIAPPSRADVQAFEDARSSTSGSDQHRSRSSSPPAPHDHDRSGERNDWRRRVTKALVQLTAEVSAMRELADGSSTSMLGRYFARGRMRRRRWFVKLWFLLWAVAKRVVVDAAVLAVVLLVLRWRWRERAESWWELLGVWMGFISDEVRVKLRQGVREGLKMGRGVKLLAANANRSGESARREGV